MLALKMSCGVGWWGIGGVQQGRPSVLDRPSEPSEPSTRPLVRTRPDPSGPVRTRPAPSGPSRPVQSGHPSGRPVDV